MYTVASVYSYLALCLCDQFNGELCLKSGHSSLLNWKKRGERGGGIERERENEREGEKEREREEDEEEEQKMQGI